MPRARFNLFGLKLECSFYRKVSAEAIRRSQAEFARTHILYKGEFSSWADACAQAGGYDAPEILRRAILATRAVCKGEAAFERDTVLFDQVEISYPLLAALLYVASLQEGSLSVLDFGGALGSSYRQNRTYLQSLKELSWSVVEQEGFVTTGKEEFETEALHFYYDIQSCIQEQEPNFLLLSSVLQYLEKPYEVLERLLVQGIKYVLIDRAMAQRLGKDRLVIQQVPETIYKASYPVWLMDAKRMETVFHAAGYEVLERFDPHPGSLVGPEGFQSPFQGWFLKKRA